MLFHVKKGASESVTEMSPSGNCIKLHMLCIVEMNDIQIILLRAFLIFLSIL